MQVEFKHCLTWRQVIVMMEAKATGECGLVRTVCHRRLLEINARIRGDGATSAEPRCQPRALHVATEDLLVAQQRPETTCIAAPFAATIFVTLAAPGEADTLALPASVMGAGKHANTDGDV